MKHTNWFVLPPLTDFYYQTKNPTQTTLLKFEQGCLLEIKSPMDFIYSKESMKVFLSKNFDENTNQLVFRLTHLMPDIKVFWYIDANFVRTSQTFHEMTILPKKGNYIITVLNELGNGLKRAVEITE